MKYYIDTEFIEGFHKPIFGKRRHFIDLISIGIVAEDGSTYYALSKEFNSKDADEWVKENVLSHIVVDWVKSHSGDSRNWALDRIEGVGKGNAIKVAQREIGKSNKQIMSDIVQFICPIATASEYAGVGSLEWGLQGFLENNPPEFYGYYCDYDWVLFCSLFGRMIDLPKGFPMYCIDLKQKLDEKATENRNKVYAAIQSPRKATFEESLEYIKKSPMYPQQVNEHNALADAKWNMELHKFLLSI